jgi:hypothetical protein
LLHATDGPLDLGKRHDKLIFRAQLFYFIGEVEAVFGIWLIPLFIAIITFHGWSTMVEYVGNVNVADPIFVVVIMAMASSLPIIRFTEAVIAKVSAMVPLRHVMAYHEHLAHWTAAPKFLAQAEYHRRPTAPAPGCRRLSLPQSAAGI